MDQLSDLRRSLKQIWGYDDFRPLQAEVIESILAGQDSLVIVATGGGKSLCFQLPAIMEQGLTLVISPLLSLMENHIQDLQQKKLAASTIHSSMTASDRRQVLQSIPKLRLLYLSPETLLSAPVWQQLSQPKLKINSLILDEAHVLVQWGDGFRPDYRRLGAVRQELVKTKSEDHGRIAIAAFTATADPQAQKQLISCLQLETPKRITTSPFRGNLALEVAISWTMAGRKAQTLKYLRQHPDQSGLIYIRSRRGAEALTTWLGSEGILTKPYHAGLPARERREIERAWQVGDLPFVVASSAFGMGIDKANVRFVLHFQTPLTLSEYIQEVGRGGRDGQFAQALMLVSEPTGILDGSDRQRQEFFIQEAQQQRQKAQKLINQIPRQGNYYEVCQKFTGAASTLGFLHSESQLIWHTPFEYEMLCAKDYRLPDPDRKAIKQMEDFILTKECRWAFLVRAYGFFEEAKNLHCGICDRCLKGKFAK
jgi:ATP-dependent DNA helicase RecQ